MQQVDEDLQPLLDDGVRSPALDVHYETDAAGVALVVRIVQAGRLGGGLRPVDRLRVVPSLVEGQRGQGRPTDGKLVGVRHDAFRYEREIFFMPESHPEVKYNDHIRAISKRDDLRDMRAIRPSGRRPSAPAAGSGVNPPSHRCGSCSSG